MTDFIPSKTQSLATSVALHLVLMMTILWIARDNRKGSTPETSRHVGLAVTHRMPDHMRYAVDQASADQDSIQVGEMPQSGGGNPPPAIAHPLDLNATLANMLGHSPQAQVGDGDSGALGVLRLPGDGSAEAVGDAQLVPGGPKRGQGNGQTTTSLFGVTGTGATFVYVFDRSESMTGAALRRAKAELSESLKTLTEQQQFQLIFYNHEPRSFSSVGGAKGLVLADQANRRRASDFIESIVAAGGTEHELALRMALRLSPDVLFFLTDAKIQTMATSAMEEISQRAQTSGTVIHGIQFGSGPSSGDSFVRDLALRNGGGYQYLDVTTLQ